MKRFFAILFLLVAAASLTASPMSITLGTDGAETVKGIQEALVVWALNPTSATACSGGQCCVGDADDQECSNLAREILQGGSESIARAIFPCIQSTSSAFLCEWWTDSEGVNQMVCETFPSAAQAFLDSSICASQLAATRF